MRVWRPAAGVLMTGWLLVACSRSHDAWFANPCADSLTIRTFYAERGDNGIEKSDEMIAEALLSAAAVTKVDDAFQDASGFTWFLEIVGGPTIPITKEQMPKWFVSLPASVCKAG